MAIWRVALQVVNGRAGATTVVADEATVDAGGHLLLKTEGKIVTAITPGTWVIVERELDT